ncbi:unnamed protein product [Ectocarpus sp. CCAP 1310/34]|nr:unnamed protein product [Ectocarpus sp. CCAP 1310/34]
MKEILDEAAFRSSALDDVEEKREIAQLNGDHRALKQLKELEAKLERRRVENNLFIQAVSDATDFEQERERLDNNVLHKARSRRELLQTSLAKGTSFVLPSQSKSNCPQTNAAEACTPLPGFPSARYPEPRRAGGGAGGSGAGGNGRVRFVESCKDGESCASNSAIVYNKGDRESRTLVAQEHHLRQRRLHHQNFKKSASARKLAETDGMAGASSPSPYLGGGGGRGNDGSVGEGHVVVTTSVGGYSRDKEGSLVLSAGRMTDGPAPSAVSCTQAEVDFSGGSGSTTTGRQGSTDDKFARVGQDGDSPCPERLGSASLDCTNVGGRGEGQGEAPRSGEGQHLASRGNGVYSIDQGSTTISAMGLTEWSATAAAAAAAAAAEAAAVVAKEPTERENNSSSATEPRTPVEGTPCRPDVEDDVVAGQKGRQPESTTTGLDWYKCTQLSVEASRAIGGVAAADRRVESRGSNSTAGCA